MRWTILALLAACASTTGKEGAVASRVAPDPEGVRVWFRLAPGTDARPVLRAESGRLEEVRVSPDLRTASALWRDPAGAVECRWPRRAVARRTAGGPMDVETALYVLLEARGVTVLARLPRGCPMLARLPLEVRVEEDLLPARLLLPGGEEVAISLPRSLVRFPLPRDAHGVLLGGDFELAVVTRDGRACDFLVGVDPDGTPTASSGYVRPWRQG